MNDDRNFSFLCIFEFPDKMFVMSVSFSDEVIKVDRCVADDLC